MTCGCAYAEHLYKMRPSSEKGSYDAAVQVDMPRLAEYRMLNRNAGPSHYWQSQFTDIQQIPSPLLHPLCDGHKAIDTRTTFSILS